MRLLTVFRQIALAGAAAAVFAMPAGGQSLDASSRLGVDGDRLPMPEYAPDEVRPPRIAPGDATPDAPAAERPAPAAPPDLSVGFVLRGVRIVGATIFDDATLAATVAPFLDRRVAPETLPAITDAITRVYVDAGYVSSGAIVPDQEVADGLLEVRVIEGRVTALEIETSGGMRSRFVRERLGSALDGPLSLGRLDHALRLLQLDPRVARVDAVLAPTETLGETRVRLEIEESETVAMEGRVANDVAPALGGSRATGSFWHRNVSGFGDHLEGAVSGARGLFDVDVAYRVPLVALPFVPLPTELEFHGGYAEGEIVEGDADIADIEFRNEIARYGVSVAQPLFRSLEDEVRLVATLERITTRLTTDAGVPFLRSRLFLVRADAEWIRREETRVFAARVRGTFGLDAWDATTPTSGRAGDPALPDAEFQSVLVQLQYAQRVPTPLGDGELLARTDLQLASGTLYPVEAFAMGGSATVRGYAENLVVSDNGWLGSVELRVPVLPATMRPHALRVAPFVDVGYAWNDDDRDVSTRFDRRYASVGLGLLYDYADRFEVRGWYGRALDRDTTPSGDPLQAQGVHVALRVRFQ